MPMKPFVALVASNHWRIVIWPLANWTNWNIHPCFKSSALLRPQILHRQKNGSLCGLLPWTDPHPHIPHIMMSFLPWESSKTGCLGLKCDQPKFFNVINVIVSSSDFWFDTLSGVWYPFTLTLVFLKYWKLLKKNCKIARKSRFVNLYRRFLHVKYELRWQGRLWYIYKDVFAVSKCSSLFVDKTNDTILHLIRFTLSLYEFWYIVDVKPVWCEATVCKMIERRQKKVPRASPPSHTKY